MFIMGIGTAVPRCRYSQLECWEVLRKTASYQKLSPRAQFILRKVLTGHNGIETRHLALESLEDAFGLTADVLHRRFSDHAPRLATSAAQQAMTDSGISAPDVDAVLISTCTGYLCPGLTSYVAEALGLGSGVLCLDLVGQGCGAALPNLRTAEALLQSRRYNRVLSVCVEICSAAFYLDDDPGVLISACLFGDGAAATVLGNEAGPRRSVRWVHSNSVLHPEKRDILRLEQRNGMLRNVLAPVVPGVAAAQAVKTLAAGLAETGVPKADIRGWILHPGGRDVLTAVGENLGIEAGEMQPSSTILRRYGNMSSPTVLFVLNAALNNAVAPGLWWMCSFGAGFSCHGALLEVSQ